jgi:NAD(P)-dependent dehydrogenase (short-subunit alcohol dehydrogenase family)
VPLLVASDDGYLVNTSSVNGFLATLGPGRPHTAYSAAKFAVKGFSEALIEDFRTNAPHVKVAVVMPGHIGTDIVINSRVILGNNPDAMSATEIADTRRNMALRGFPTDSVSDEDLVKMVAMMGEMFRNTAPTSAAEAATVILDGVKANQWRILIGDDARKLDEAVRANPEGAYGPDGLSLGSILNVASGDAG